MSLVVKASLNNTVSLATLNPATNHRQTFGDYPSMAGELIQPGDACYVRSDGSVMRAIEDQANAAPAINDVQTMSLNPSQFLANLNANSTYVLGYQGQYTPAQLITATAATIQTAIQALSTVGAGNILVTGTFPNFVFTAASGLAGTDLDLIEVDSSLIDTIDNTPAILLVTHTTVGQPAGTGNPQGSSRVRGFATILYKRGQPISLYDACVLAYSDGNLTPGQDLYLSGTVPGGLDTAVTLTGQVPIAYALDTQNIYVYAVR